MIFEHLSLFNWCVLGTGSEAVDRTPKGLDRLGKVLPPAIGSGAWAA